MTGDPFAVLLADFAEASHNVENPPDGSSPRGWLEGYADGLARALVVLQDAKGRPYTDAELARGQDDTRDQTLTLALLADRVTAHGQVIETLENRLDALIERLDLAEGA